MPTFDFAGPDGKTHSVEGPEGATPQQAFQFLQQQLGAQQSPQTQAPGMGSKLLSAVTDIPSEIYSAGKSAVSAIADAGPNSQANAARMQSMQSGSPFDLTPAIQGVMNVGKAALGVPQLAASPITGTARSVIGNTFDALAPSFTPDQQKSMADSGVNLPSGKDVADLAMMAARPVGANPVGLTTKPAPIPAGAELKSAAHGGYDAAKNSGVEIKPTSLQGFTAKVQGDLNADGLNEILAPRTFQVLDKLGNPPAGATVTTNDFRTLQRALGYAAKSPDPTERLAAARAIESLNNHLENLPASDLSRGTPADAAAVSATIKEANANYGAYKRSEGFDLRGEKAQNNAAAANSGLNLENNLRTQVRQILNNPNLQRGYDSDTLAAFKEFNRGSRAANVLRAIGNVLGGGGGVVGTGMSAGAGMLAGGPVGAIAAPAAGLAARLAGNALSMRQFDNLSQMIRASSPLARSAAPIPIGAPNPLLGNIPLAQLPQMFGLGFRPMLGVMQSPADQQQ